MGAEEEARIRADVAVYILTRIVPPIHLLHEAGFMHADVKPDNVMYDAESGAVTVIDFGGVAPLHQEGEVPYPFMGGTLLYMDPERVLAYKESWPYEARAAVDW